MIILVGSKGDISKYQVRILPWGQGMYHPTVSDGGSTSDDGEGVEELAGTRMEVYIKNKRWKG